MRTVVLGILIILSMAVPVLASGDEGNFLVPFSYISPDTSFLYAYSTNNGQQDGSLACFATVGSHGELRGCVTDGGTTQPSLIRLWLRPSPSQTIVVSMIPTTDPDIMTLQLEVTNFGVMYWSYRSSTSEVLFKSSTVTDCVGLELSPTWQAARDAAYQAAEDIAAKQNAALTITQQEWQVLASTTLPSLVGRVIDDCYSAIVAPQDCQLIHDYNDCERCCRKAEWAQFFLCNGVAILGPWGIAASATCNTVAHLAGSCGELACTGQPGDPNCIDPPSCENPLVGGTCEGECVGERHMCGKCNYPNRKQCCAPV